MTSDAGVLTKASAVTGRRFEITTTRANANDWNEILDLSDASPDHERNAVIKSFMLDVGDDYGFEIRLHNSTKGCGTGPWVEAVLWRDGREVDVTDAMSGPIESNRYYFDIGNGRFPVHIEVEIKIL